MTEHDGSSKCARRMCHGCGCWFECPRHVHMCEDCAGPFERKHHGEGPPSTSRKEKNA